MDVSTKTSRIKSQLIKSITALNAGGGRDLDDNYLESLSIARLKHILLFSKTMKIGKKADGHYEGEVR